MRGRPPNVCNCVCGGRGRLHLGEYGWSVRCEFDPGFASAPVHKTPKRAAEAWGLDQMRMDRLTRDAVCAYHGGQSYGKYIAGIPVPQATVRFPKKQMLDSKEPRCVNCGMLIPIGVRSKKYCGVGCAEEARAKKIEEFPSDGQSTQILPAEKPQRLCILCGKPIPVHDSRRKYCSAECAEQARAQTYARYKSKQAQKRKIRMILK